MCRASLQILILSASFSVPAGYNVFGYSDDPIVCNDGPEVASDICTDFKGAVHGDVEYASLYVPVLKKMVDGRRHAAGGADCGHRL